MLLLDNIPSEALVPTVRPAIRTTKVILDIGCGICPQSYIRPNVHICYEPHLEYLQHLQIKVHGVKDRSYVFLLGTWRDAIKLFPEKSVDSVFLLDVIEHVGKKEGVELLEKTERVAREQIVVFTPLGFVPQDCPKLDAWGLHGGKWQKHVSGWEPIDFKNPWKVFVSPTYHGMKEGAVRGAIFAIRDF